MRKEENYIDKKAPLCIKVEVSKTIVSLCKNKFVPINLEHFAWLSPRNFFGGGTKSIVRQISFVMLIFLLFSDQISGGRSLRGGANWFRGRPCPPPPPWKKASCSCAGTLLNYDSQSYQLLQNLTFIGWHRKNCPEKVFFDP